MTRVEVWLAAPVGDQRGHARGLLRRLAADVLGVDGAALDLRREPGGRPFLALRPAPDGGRRPDVDLAGVEVSVSHTRGLTAVAVSTAGRVGVDVEAVRELPAVALAGRWLTAPEARWVAAGDPTRRLLWVWTHKEALGKVRGTGLARGGLTRPVPLPAAGAEHSTTLRRLAGDPGLTCAAPPPPDGHLLCVAGGPGTAGVPVLVRSVAG